MHQPQEQLLADQHPLDVCAAVARDFGTTAESQEMMYWPEMADEVTRVAENVVSENGYDYRRKVDNPARLTLERACASCVLSSCTVRNKITSMADDRDQAVRDEIESTYAPGVASFLSMDKLDYIPELKQGENTRLSGKDVGDLLSGEDVELPSLNITTPKGHDVRLVPLFAANDELGGMHLSTVATQEQGTVFRKVQEALVKAVDTAGSLGLHHLRGRNLRLPAYYTLDHKEGTAVAYIAQLGVVDGVPTYGLLTSTSTSREQIRVVKAVGGDVQLPRFKDK